VNFIYISHVEFLASCDASLSLGDLGSSLSPELGYGVFLLSPRRDDKDRLGLTMDVFRRPDKAGQDDEDSLV